MPSAPQPCTQVLLITDIGSDVDDIWCLLALAALQREGLLRVVGIVTTGGNCRTRALLARRWAHALSLVDASLVVEGAPDVDRDRAVPGFFADEHAASMAAPKEQGHGSSEIIFELLRRHGPQVSSVSSLCAPEGVP